MPTTVTNIPVANVKLRWEEPYVSEALNLQNAVSGFGVLRGFRPVPSAGKVIAMQADPQDGLSLASVPSLSDERARPIVVIEGDVNLDLSAFDDERVYLALEVDYQTLTPTTARWAAYSQAEYDSATDLILWVCAVDVPAGAGAITAQRIKLAPRVSAWRSLQTPDAAARPAMPAQKFVSRHLGSSAFRVLNATGDAALAFDADEFDQGEGSVKVFLDGATSGDMQFVNRALVPVQAGDRVRVAFRAKFAAFEVVDGAPFVAFFDKDNAPTIVGGEDTAIAGTVTEGWSEYVEDFVAPANTVYAVAGWLGDGISGGEAFFEALYVDTTRGFDGARGSRALAEPVVASLQALVNDDELGPAMLTEWEGEDEVVTRATASGKTRVLRGMDFEVQDAAGSAVFGVDEDDGRLTGAMPVDHVKLTKTYAGRELSNTVVSSSNVVISSAIFGITLTPDSGAASAIFEVYPMVPVGAVLDRVRLTFRTQDNDDTFASYRVRAFESSSNVPFDASGETDRLDSSEATYTRLGAADRDSVVTIDVTTTRSGVANRKLRFNGAKALTVHVVVSTLAASGSLPSAVGSLVLEWFMPELNPESPGDVWPPP